MHSQKLTEAATHLQFVPVRVIKTQTFAQDVQLYLKRCHMKSFYQKRVELTVILQYTDSVQPKDVDNAQKILLDAGNGYLYVDDRQVAKINLRVKLNCAYDGFLITVREFVDEEVEPETYYDPGEHRMMDVPPKVTIPVEPTKVPIRVLEMSHELAAQFGNLL